MNSNPTATDTDFGATDETRSSNKVHDAVANAKHSAAAAYSSVKNRAEETLSQVRDRSGQLLHDAREKSSQSLDDSPLAAIVGAVALGTLLGTLIPRSEKERELMNPIGAKLTEAVLLATGAAKAAGIEALDEFGLSTNGVQSKIDEIFDTLARAAGAATEAANEAIRKPVAPTPANN